VSSNDIGGLGNTPGQVVPEPPALCTVPRPLIPPQGLCTWLTWVSSVGGCRSEGRWTALGGQGLTQPAWVTAWWGQGPIHHVWAGHGGHCWLWTEVERKYSLPIGKPLPRPLWGPYPLPALAQNPSGSGSPH
jgi:hypothetical protein